MGSFQPFASKQGRWQSGKTLTPSRIEKLQREFEENGEGWYKEFKIKELFDIRPTKTYNNSTNSFLFKTQGETPVIANTSKNNGVKGFCGLSSTEKGGIITFSDTTDANTIFYHDTPFIGYPHVQGLYPKGNICWNKRSLLFFATLFKKVAMSKKFNYGKKFRRDIAKEIQIILPVSRDGTVDISFMNRFIAELEAERVAELEVERVTELEAYLTVTGLKDYQLSDDEKQVLKEVDSFNWSGFTYKKIFNQIQQGKRLKKEDQLPGNIPFVMAGTTNTGIANYVSNPIAKFPKNSITVDIFGNTFYRSFVFGAGDDTGVYWSDENNYSVNTMLCFATAIAKSLDKKFDFGKKLRSSQSFNFKMFLPQKNGNPDYDKMETLVSAVKKLVIKDVVEYADRKIATTKTVINS